jgi:tRNA threonylcarbamoyladenosine biosynthesis protein TsaB
MLVLGIETSGLRCSVALCSEKSILAEYNTEITNLHAEILGSLVQDALRRLNLTADSPEMIAVASGPGSFTGLRIGMAYAKGFAHALKKPVISVTNFEVLAYHAGANFFPVDVFIDARMRRFYHARFNHPRRLPEVMQFIDYAQIREIRKDSAQFIVQKQTVSEFLNHPELKDIFIVAADYSAGVLCRIAIDKYLSGIQEDLTNLEPLYLQKFAGV